MKYIIVSDIHGAGFYADKIKKLVEEEKPNNLILLGDLYYHGPRNQLPEGYNPMHVCEVFNSLKDIILCVKGNCDAEVDEMISEFPMQEELELVIENQVVMFTHGHKYNINNLPKKNIDVLVYGHFHTGFIKKQDGILFLNPGSISIPKENTKHSYILWKDNEIYLKDINGDVIEKRILG